MNTNKASKRNSDSPLDNFYAIHRAIRQSNGLTVSGIEAETNLHPRTIQRHVKRMTAEGFIKAINRKPSGYVYFASFE